MPAPSCLRLEEMDILTDSDTFSAIVLGEPIGGFKFLDDGTGDTAGLLTGYGAVFGSPDLQGDIIAPGAFSDTIAAHHAAGTAPPLLWSHRQAEPAGRWLGMGEDARGLRVKGQLNLGTAAGRKAYQHAMAGDVSGLSVGYSIPSGGAARGTGGMRHLHKVDLHEISLVAIPAHPQARLTSVKNIASPRDLEELLRESGLSKSVARKVVSGGWNAVVSPEIDPDELQALAEMIGEKAHELQNILRKR